MWTLTTVPVSERNYSFLFAFNRRGIRNFENFLFVQYLIVLDPIAGSYNEHCISVQKDLESRFDSVSNNFGLWNHFQNTKIRIQTVHIKWVNVYVYVYYILYYHSFVPAVNSSRPSAFSLYIGWSGAPFFFFGRSTFSSCLNLQKGSNSWIA